MDQKIKSWASIVLVTLLLISCAPAAPGQASPEIETARQSQGLTPLWFDALPASIPLTSAEQGEAAAWIFNQIFQTPASPSAPFPVETSQPAMLFLSLSDGSSKADVLRASGSTLQAATRALVSLFNAHPLSDSETLWAKLDFVYEVRFFDRYSLSLPAEDPASLFGLAFESASGIALLPEVLAAETIIDSDNEFRLSNLTDYLEEKDQPLDYLNKFGSSENAPAYRFSTRGFFYEDGRVIPLYRGHRTYNTFTPDQLLASAVNGGEYLIDAVKEDGRFVYAYLPKSDSESESYNILRHAGTIYAMADLYQETGDARLLDAIERAIGFLGTYMRRCPVPAGFENCIVENNEAKLGGNALAVLALTQYMQATGDAALLEEARSLARWIVSNQDASGEFKIHKAEFPSGAPMDFSSQYYPGEAIYALARLYTLDPNDLWLSAAANGALWLANDRIQGKVLNDIVHDHWLLLGLDALQHIQPNPVFVESARQIAAAIAASQNLNPQYPDWLGSYYSLPRSTPAATRSEGLLAAYRILRDFDASGQADWVMQTVRRNITFQLGTQFHPESVMYLQDPQRALGGFHQSLTNFEIRNDYVQHNLSSILALYREMKASD